MSIEKDIETLIGELTPEQIKSLMKDVKKPSIRKIDGSHRRRRLNMTDLYFSAEPKPYHLINGRPMTPEEYSDMRESVRQQVLSGVDL